MAEKNSNNIETNSSTGQPSTPSGAQVPPAPVREFIQVDTSSNSRLNKGLENDIEIKSSSDIEK